MCQGEVRWKTCRGNDEIVNLTWRQFWIMESILWIPDSSADHWIPNPWIWDSTRKISRILVYARVKLPVLKKWTLQLYVISSVENLFFFFWCSLGISQRRTLSIVIRISKMSTGFVFLLLFRSFDKDVMITERLVILTLTYLIITVPTKSVLVVVTKDLFVSLVMNLNNKNNVCKQWCILLGNTGGQSTMYRNYNKICNILSFLNSPVSSSLWPLN